MNLYRHSFVALCPNNGQRIFYRLSIETPRVVMVEAIAAACRAASSGFHEEIADALVALFGGRQVLRAHHHGVEIETTRGRPLQRGQLR